MKPRKIKDGVYSVGSVDWDRRTFDALIALPHGTSYNAYLVEGSSAAALIDAVDPSKADELVGRLAGVDDVRYIISQHSEQDHSGAIPRVMEKYPEAEVVTSTKGKKLLVEHLRIPEDKVRTVEDGETISLGDKTLEFLHTPWVHWPETMCTYLKEGRLMFTCDLFGSHLATSGLYPDEQWKVCEESKRYYAEVMMPFRTSIRKHLERFDGYEIDMVAPSHGPVHSDPGMILDFHRDWVSDRLANTVVIPYVSMHGSTEMMVERLTEALVERGITAKKFNLTVTDTGELAMALVDAATMVVGSPTVLTGAHPVVVSAAFLANALRPKLAFTSIIGSYGWGGRMVDQLKGVMTNLKSEMIEPVLVKGMPDRDGLEELDRLAEEIASRHRGAGIAP